MINIRSHTLKAVALIVLLGACLFLPTGCRQEAIPTADYVVTLPPLQMILEPLVAGRKTVACLLPPGVSPHTFALRPSSARLLERADAVFYVDDTLDGWATQGRTGFTCSLLALVPESDRVPNTEGHDHGDGTHGEDHDSLGANPHFWSDPHIVANLVPALVQILGERDPAGKAHYEANADVLLQELTELDNRLAESMAKPSSTALVAFHPSWAYFCKRYDLRVAAYVEPIPGKELTPRTILRLREQLSTTERVVVLSEAQLPRKSADALAEVLSAQVVVIDPLGGRAPLMRYTDLLEYNAERLREALQ